MISSISRQSLLDHRASAFFTPVQRVLEDRVSEVFHQTIDCLIMIGYVLQYAFFKIMTLNSDASEVFNRRVLCHTHNFAKYSELGEYVQLRRRPLRISEQMEPFSNQFDLTINAERELRFNPQNSGMCMGGVTLFLQTWLQTGDMQHTSRLFEEGVPFQGALYQNIYCPLLQCRVIPELTPLIKETVETYPTPVTVDNQFSPLFEGIYAYLEAGHHPRQGGMYEWVKTWLWNERSLHLSADLMGSLLYVGDMYAFDLNQVAQSAVTNLAGLNSYEISRNVSPGAILRQLPSLRPGAYKLSLPCYDSFGRATNSRHCMAFVIQEGGPSYFYDPNSCIAFAPHEELQETIGRLCTQYTGFDYSEDLNGAAPSFCKKVSNFFRNRANPPSAPLTDGCELIRAENL